MKEMPSGATPFAHTRVLCFQALGKFQTFKSWMGQRVEGAADTLQGEDG